MLVVTAALFAPVFWLALHDDNSQNTWLDRFAFHHIFDALRKFAQSKWLFRVNFALAIFGFVNGIRGKQRFSFVLLGAWLLTPFACLWLIGLYRPDYRPAYVLGVLVPYVILYAAGITALGRAKYPALVALLAFHGWVLFHTERPFAQDWRTSSQIVASDNIPIIVCPQSGYGALKYGNGTIRMTSAV